MLYEEALYTVLHRAGTMGPDQVEDEEILLGYLQQVSWQPHTTPPTVRTRTFHWCPCQMNST